jgi:sigma-E factor negative regulatory protein RseB
MVHRVVGATLASLWQPVAWAQSIRSAEAPGDLRAWLMRFQDAAGNRNYQGTLVFSAGGVVSSSRVAHYCDGAQRYERIDSLDGQARTTLRHNEVVQTQWPVARVAVMEPRDAVINFPALPPGGQAGGDAYEVRNLGTDRVAGHEAQVLMMRPRDALRFGQRLWAERVSGLLLRADLLGPQGEVLESSVFSELTIGVKPQPEVVLGALRKVEGYRIVRAAVGRVDLDAEGWALVRPVAGFSLVSSMKRPLDAANPDGARSLPVVQAIFSDGLTHVSVFVEPYDAQRHKPMRTALGATHTLMNRSGDWWITVVGDVPMATIQQFAAAFERRR